MIGLYLFLQCGNILLIQFILFPEFLYHLLRQYIISYLDIHFHSSKNHRVTPFSLLIITIIDNYRMNIFKSAFSSSKNNQLQQTLDQLYQDIKHWDQARAKSLQNHIKVIQLIMDALNEKVVQVQKYIDGLQKLMAARIQEITTYCRNGVNDSQFFLVPCSLNAMKPTHQLLKHLLMEQSQRQLSMSKKATILSEILQKLKILKAQECSQKNQGSERQGVTVSELKSNIRFLIDCQLPDLIVEVVNSCKQVSTAQRQSKDLYWAIEKLVRKADKQLKMHNEIGGELLNLIYVFSKRQKQLRMQLRQILCEWVKEDLQDKIFQEQLHKNKTDELIDDYYDIQNIAPKQSHLWGNIPLSDYLKNFHILPFTLHEKLVLYCRQLLYNGKIQARILMTQQKFVHLFRLQGNQPDFTFTMSKNIRIRTKNALCLFVIQWKRTIILRQEIQFQFTLEFNLQNDQREFIEKARAHGCQIQ